MKNLKSGPSHYRRKGPGWKRKEASMGRKRNVHGMSNFVGKKKNKGNRGALPRRWWKLQIKKNVEKGKDSSSGLGPFNRPDKKEAGGGGQDAGH